MKKISICVGLCLLLCCAVPLSGCGAQTPSPTVQEPRPLPESTPEGETESSPAAQPPAAEENAGVLVAWFSATGTTADIAQRLAAQLSADVYEIVPETPYSSADLNYTDTDSRSSVERKDASARPAIAGVLPDMQGYGTVLIGYPIWHGQAPRIISTFLESCDLAGKTVVPFCTSASSGIGSSAADLQPLTKGASWKDGIRFAANASDEELAVWADGILPDGDHSGTLTIRVGDVVLSASFAENSSADALKALLAHGDITVDMRDYGGFEKVGALGSTLPRSDESVTTAPGDIILYQGNQIAIYYGENTWDFTRLGRIENIGAQELRDILGAGDMTVELALQP